MIRLNNISCRPYRYSILHLPRYQSPQKLTRELQKLSTSAVTVHPAPRLYRASMVRRAPAWQRAQPGHTTGCESVRVARCQRTRHGTSTSAYIRPEHREDSTHVLRRRPHASMPAPPSDDSRRSRSALARRDTCCIGAGDATLFPRKHSRYNKEAGSR